MSVKNWVINCDVCDSRRMDPEVLSGVERLVLNADLLLVSRESRRALSQAPAVMNIDTVLEAPGDCELICRKGDVRIGASESLEKDGILTVTGDLILLPGAERYLERCVWVAVSGTLFYPQGSGLEAFADRFRVSGRTIPYPEGYLPVRLPGRTVIDSYFVLRAEPRTYFSGRKLAVPAPLPDLEALLAKEPRFQCSDCYLPERQLAGLLPLFGQEAKLHVIPEGYAFLFSDAELNPALLRKYGRRLYIAGDLKLKRGAEQTFSQIEALTVEGAVRLQPEQEEAFLELGAEYGELEIVREPDRSIQNSPLARVSASLLAKLKHGLACRNCAMVILTPDITEEEILEKLTFTNCAYIKCTKEQSAAVAAVARNAGQIGEAPENGGDFDMSPQNLLKSKVTNADLYVL